MGHLNCSFQTTVILLLSSLIITSLNLVTGQISTPCTTSMINSITPCVNFITGSGNNGLTPSVTCCDSLLSLVSDSMDCVCLVILANVPFPLPVNQVLALFLPQACNVSGMPAMCKASGSPLPAPGPALLGSDDPTLPPIAPSPISPQRQVSETIGVAEAPNTEILPLAPGLAPAELTPILKQKRPRKLQDLDQYYILLSP